MAEKTIPIAEIFGPTLQGEGALAGLPTYFVRVGGCDFSCAWCDSAHAVDPVQVRGLPRYTEDVIANQLFALEVADSGPEWVTISGGNPALYDLTELVKYWKDHEYHTYKSDEAYPRYRVAVETQGTRWQRWFDKVNLLTVSPKPPSSGMDTKQNIYEFIEIYVAGAEENFHMRRARDMAIPPDDWKMVLKVVVFDETDYDFARALHQRYPLIKFYISCGTAMGGLSGSWSPPAYAMPELGTLPVIDTDQTLLARYRWLADTVKADDAMADVVCLPQLHALTWGITTRGT